MIYAPRLYLLFFLIGFFAEITPHKSRDELMSLYQKSTKPKIRKKRNLITPLAFEKEIPMATYLLTFQTPSNFKDLALRIYWQGQIVPEKDGVFQLKAEKHRHQFDVIVGMFKPPKKLNFEFLEIPAGIDYAHYKIIRKNDINDEKKYCWVIEKTKKNNGLTVTPNMIFIFTDPAHIKKFESQSWEKSSDIVMLPIISFINSPDLHDASVKAILAALDTDLFHGKPVIEKTEKSDVHISQTKES